MKARLELVGFMDSVFCHIILYRLRKSTIQLADLVVADS